jgi:hypothetical protein
VSVRLKKTKIPSYQSPKPPPHLSPGRLVENPRLDNPKSPCSINRVQIHTELARDPIHTELARRRRRRRRCSARPPPVFDPGAAGRRRPPANPAFRVPIRTKLARRGPSSASRIRQRVCRTPRPAASRPTSSAPKGSPLAPIKPSQLSKQVSGPGQ